MDFNNIVEYFEQMTGCEIDSLNENIGIIDNAIFQIKAIVNFDKAKTDDVKRCEYAAACVANYDYLVKESAKGHIICTAEGKATSSDDTFSLKISSAFQMKMTALSLLKNIIVDNDFLFVTTGGNA